MNILLHSVKDGLFTAAASAPVSLISRKSFSDGFGSVFYTSAIASAILRKFVPDYEGSSLQRFKSFIVISGASLISGFIYGGRTHYKGQMALNLISFATLWAIRKFVFKSLDITEKKVYQNHPEVKAYNIPKIPSKSRSSSKKSKIQKRRNSKRIWRSPSSNHVAFGGGSKRRRSSYPFDSFHSPKNKETPNKDELLDNLENKIDRMRDSLHNLCAIHRDLKIELNQIKIEKSKLNLEANEARRLRMGAMIGIGLEQEKYQRLSGILMSFIKDQVFVEAQQQQMKSTIHDLRKDVEELKAQLSGKEKLQNSEKKT